MSGMDVISAFEALMEAFRQERYALADALREATLRGDLAEAQRHLDQAQRIERFLSAVQRLWEAWTNPELPLPVPEIRETISFRQQDSRSFLASDAEKSPELAFVDRIFGGGTGGFRRRTRVQGPSIKTPVSAFYVPILEALEELGGRGSFQEVMDLVYDRMKDLLTEDDLNPLPSGGDIRWRNTAQWARYTMVRRGLLRDDSPRGVWEISEAGRAYLQEARRRQKK